MKLDVRKAPEPGITRQDTLLFRKGKRTVVVAQATIGSFDSMPYEPKNQTWGYSAELHQHEGRLYVLLLEYETTHEVKDGDWVHQTKDEQVVYVSEDGGATWNPGTAASSPTLNDATRLDRLDSP